MNLKLFRIYLKMFRYPSIESYKSAIKSYKKCSDEIIRYRGTIKLHGTHADIVRHHTIWFQSRNGIISKEKDNMGFATHMSNIDVNKFFDYICQVVGSEKKMIMISGEWCGGNIQKNVALTQLEKMFVIYGVCVDNQWMDIQRFPELRDHSHRIYHILEFEYFEMNFDLKFPKANQEYLTKTTNRIEKCCPVGKYFGVEGVGEGVVWNPIGTVKHLEDTEYDGSKFSDLVSLTFKIKGAEHSVIKVKNVVEVDLEVMKSIDELVEATCTENRLNQGLSEISENNVSNFIKWIVADIFKEESDRIHESGVEEKKFIAALNKKAATWYR